MAKGRFSGKIASFQGMRVAPKMNLDKMTAKENRRGHYAKRLMAQLVAAHPEMMKDELDKLIELMLSKYGLKYKART